MFSKRPGEPVVGAPLFPFVLVILVNYWKMRFQLKNFRHYVFKESAGTLFLRYLEINKTQISTDPYKSYSSTVFINTTHTHWRHNKSSSTDGELKSNCV